MTDIDVVLPALGETITEATLLSWLKDPGAVVAAGDAIAEVSTDKVDTEIVAPAAGALEPMAEPGSVVQVGDLIARLRQTTGPASTPPPLATPPPPSVELPPAVVVGTGTPVLSPAVREALERHQLAGDDVARTGPRGRLLVADVEAAAARGGHARAVPPSPAVTSAPPVERPAPMTRPLSWRGKTPVDVTHLAPEGERLAVVLLRAAMNAARTMGLPLGATDVAALWDHRHGLRAIVGAEGLRLDALLAAAPTAGAAPRLVVADLDADGVELAPPALDVPIVVAFHREAEMLTRVELVGRAAWASARRIGLEVHSDVVDPSAYLAEIRRLVETADWDSA